METGEDTAYVYGILSAPEQKSISSRGVGRSKVRIVEHAGLAALTSNLQRNTLVAGDVRAHWRVLEEAFEKATVLPLRFGMVLESEDAVRERLLEPNAERLGALLSEMAGLVQLNLKAHYDEDLLLADVVRESPGIAALRERVQGAPEEMAAYPERVRLGQLVAEAVQRHREQDAALALQALEPLAVAATAEQIKQPNAAFDLAFLVPRAGRERFDARVGDLREELGKRVELRYVGPLPPYSFAHAELSTEDEAWA